MSKAKITIDDNSIEVDEGSYLLDAARSLGLYIPTLCHYPYMTPYAACRICAVEASDGKGWSKIVTACNYPVWDGLQVLTNTPRVHNARRANLEMLMSRCAPIPVLRQLAEQIGIEKPRWGIGEDTCILCGLCVRVCDEVVGAHALTFSGRGIYRKVATPFDGESGDCILCGACAKVCPTGHIVMEDIAKRQIIHSEISLGPNSAITLPFRQAVPNVPRINPEHCIHFNTGGCKVCSRVCPKECIHYDDSEQTEELEIGAVIMATGFDNFDPTPMKQYGYGKYPNVISAEEFEMMNNAAGPTGGKILLQNGEEPRAIAILHCIGSRDQNYHKYCSRVCCMYALKFSHLVKEKTAAEVYQFYIDIRSFGKGYEEFYQRILDEDVNIIRGKGAEVTPSGYRRGAEGHLLVQCEDTLIGKFREIPVDMVILCTALEARSDAKEMARKFNISTGADGWFIEAHPKLGPVSTTTEGVFLAGTCQGPKDIPDTVAQGGAAASHAMKLLCLGEIMMDAAYAEVREEFCSGCRIRNDLCSYNAIDFLTDKKVSIINSAMCKACGTCVAACPSGAIRSDENYEIAKLLRQKSVVLCAFGSCASEGCIPGLANFYDKESIFNYVYRKSPSLDNPNGVVPVTEYKAPEGVLTLPKMWNTVRTLGQTVDVDYIIPGCPPQSNQVADVVAAVIDILSNGKPLPPKGAILGASDKSCCDECPRERNVKKVKKFIRPFEKVTDPDLCLMEQGIVCMGPATRSGCGAKCVKAGVPCRGCYGLTLNIRDQGAKMASALASIIDSTDPQEIESIIDTIPDPVGTFYRFSLPDSMLRRAQR